MDHFVQSIGTDAGTTSPFGAPCLASQVMDYYDGNTVTGDVELRPALLARRQLVRSHVRALGARRHQPHLGRHRQRRHQSHGQQPVGLDVHLSQRRPHARRQGRLLDDQRRSALLGRLLDPRRRRVQRHEHRRHAEPRGPILGLVRGRVPPDDDVHRGVGRDRPQRTADVARSSPTSSRASFPGKNVPPNASNQALCDAVHPVGAALGGTGQWGYKDDYIPHHEPFQYYASTANPHHLTVPADGAGHDTLAGLKQIGTRHPVLRQRSPAVRHAEPPVRHQRLRPAGGGDRPREACRRRRCLPSAS